MEYDTLKDELMAAVDSGLSYARTVGRDIEVEVYVSYEKRSRTEIDQGVVSTESGSIIGTAVRARRGKRVGFASVSGMTADRIRGCIDEAVQVISSASVEDNRFEGFCGPSPTGREARLDTRILELSVEDLLKYCKELFHDACAADSRVKTVSAAAEAEWGGFAVGNSNGLLASTRHGKNYCIVEAQAVDGEERRVAVEFDVAADRIIEPGNLGTEAGRRAAGMLGAKKLGLTTKMPTIWTQLPAATYFLAGLGQAVMGRLIVEKTSPLCDRMGEQIASKELNIVDDGQNPTGINTDSIDAEGIGQRTTPIIQDGVLKSFLFDHYWGRAFGVESTGNCVRGSGPFGNRLPYETAPSVGSKWLVVKPGTRSEEQLIAGIDGKAVLIRDFPMGMFHGSPSSGEFSAVANSVFLVENGEVRHPLQPVSVAGNFHEGLKNIIGIANDPRPIPYGCQTPTIAFDGFSIVG